MVVCITSGMSIVNRFMAQPPQVRPEAEYRAKRVDPAGMQAYQIDPPDRELRGNTSGNPQGNRLV
jgi:hypothetical protein